MAASTTTPSSSQQQQQQQQLRNVVVVGGTHGNEYTGTWCIKSLEKQQKKLITQYPTLDISTLLGNPVAFMQNQRFVDCDLNREFSETKLSREEATTTTTTTMTVEGKRAREIDSILGPKFGNEESKADVVIDLHSTTSNMGITIIVPEGDEVMTKAAAYVMHQCQQHQQQHNNSHNNKNRNSDMTRCLLHSIPKRTNRPNLSSVGKHGFTIEVGPVPQGVLRHDAIEKTKRALFAVLEFVHRWNCERDEVLNDLRRWYPNGEIPCFFSIPLPKKKKEKQQQQGGEDDDDVTPPPPPPPQTSGKIPWKEFDEDNPNFPLVVVHESIQDCDFDVVLRKGDALFVTLEDEIIEYDGSFGDEVRLMFINEGGYYYQSSGAGVSVAFMSKFDLDFGMRVHDDDEE